jgi:8-oxo-dGTP pyrophosphatase MutT (NUDIX family)
MNANINIPEKTAALPPFAEIACLLKHPRPALRDIPGHRRAAVALLLAGCDSGYRILFIERATHPGDPWSGNIAFPGGKVEPDDRDPRHAAERETMEELAIDLSAAEYLGRLSDFDGAHLPVLLSCFVYGVPPSLSFELNDEVKDAFWVPVADLMDLERYGMHQFTFSGDQFESPCIRLPIPDKPVLWGLTFRLLMNFLEKTTTFTRGNE